MTDCPYCGHPDPNHHVEYAIAEGVRAGEDEREIAEDYGVSIEYIRSLVRDTS